METYVPLILKFSQPHFDGSPIITALGIGPARRDDAWAIVKRFSLAK